MSGPSLEQIGLRRGDRVRFRRDAGHHWTEGTVDRRERDGSVGLRDRDGAARSIRLELLEVRTRGPRGALIWESVSERAARSEQLRLW